jgi:hypothetical protein
MEPMGEAFGSIICGFRNHRCSSKRGNLIINVFHPEDNLLCGTRLCELHETLPEDIEDDYKSKTKKDNPNNYEKVVFRLNQFFNPKRNTAIEVFMFNQTRQQDTETIEQYVTRLRFLATYCAFHDTDDEIVRQVIQSCSSSQFRRKL